MVALNTFAGTVQLKRSFILFLAVNDVHTYTAPIKPVLIRKELGHLCPVWWHFLLWPYEPLGYPESLGIYVRARARGNTPVSTLLHWDQLALKFQSCSPTVWT